mmetsp:Transcript_5942/g.12431  ORF Transcript_5942/g.12431 Transcript_5942/m.12431 type:complete len:369 (-) Transcript_5942:118-1224(-)
MASLSRAAAVLLAASVAVLPSPASSLVSFLPSSRLGCVRDRPSTLLLAGRRKEVPAAASAAAMGKKIRPGDVDTSKAVEKSKRRKALDEINSVSDLADVAADIHADAVSAAEPTGAANTPESAVAPSDEVEAQTAQIIIDEDTGMKSVQTGNAVMDVTTRRAVVLSPLGPQYRLAEMFPGVPPELRAQLRGDAREHLREPVLRAQGAQHDGAARRHVHDGVARLHALHAGILVDDDLGRLRLHLVARGDRGLGGVRGARRLRGGDGVRVDVGGHVRQVGDGVDLVQGLPPFRFFDGFRSVHVARTDLFAHGGGGRRRRDFLTTPGQQQSGRPVADTAEPGAREERNQRRRGRREDGHRGSQQYGGGAG